MQIKSNTLGKLQKIRGGNVFDSPLIFIRELLQNSQRSKASNVDFTVYDDKIIIKDDGCGCNNPENVFTLDLSSWESTTEGYGIGFWSILCIPNIKLVTVKSKNWSCSFDAIKLFKDGDLSVSQETINTITGFEVIIESNYFSLNYGEVKAYLSDVAKYLPFSTRIDNEVIPRRDIFDDFQPDSFCKEYNNKYFRAKFAISENYYTEIKMFYEKRFVRGFSQLDYIDGVFEVKNDKITLKEPDRTSYTRDEKYTALVFKLEECAKDLLLSYVKQFGVDDNVYYQAIQCWLDVKDYEKYLVFDDDMILSELEDKANNDDNNQSNENNEINVEKSVHNVNPDIFKKPDIVKRQSFTVSQNAVVAKKDGPKLKDAVKKLKRSVWCSKEEYSVYQDLIQKARYKGLHVIVAKNILYEAALKKYGILNISQLDNAFSETFIEKNICLKTSKEEAFIQLLQPIVKKYNLPEDIFLIANISIESSFVVNGEVMFKKKEFNKKDNIRVYGVTNGIHIFLDRTALGLNRFHIKKNNLGIWELKALMNSVNTIAHELSHYLYHTTDNTPEHYNHEITLQQEIISLYI